MDLHEIYRGLLAGIENMNWPEAVAVVFAIISVLAARANSIWVYPTGILSILISIYIFTRAAYKLYPDVGLNLYYLVMSIYGWYVWTRRDKAEHETPVSWCTRRELMIAAGIFTGLWIVLYLWLSTYKINNVPVLDSFCSSMACSGMWLLARRKIENWIALLISDAVAIPLFFIKKLVLFCALNVVYVIIAWLGFLAWKKIWKQERQAGAL